MDEIRSRTLQTHKLSPECELRFEVPENDATLTVELVSGHAEIFGTELIQNTKYEFHQGARAAIFTWQGCTIKLEAEKIHSCTVVQTPMGIYLNCHSALELMREHADKNNTNGPITMIVGSVDVGKSTLCRLLLNYASRMNRRPIFVDLDVGQGEIAVPGTLGALLVEQPTDIVQGWSHLAPLVFHYGHNSPGANVPLYNGLVSRLAEVCNERLRANKKTKSSGIIINTCGWVTGTGFKLLTHAAEAFEVDAILVLGEERVYNELLNQMPVFVKVVYLPTSGGVIGRNTRTRVIARERRIREYFYGTKSLSLNPHFIEIKWDEVKILKILSPPKYQMFYYKRDYGLAKHETVTPSEELMNCMLSVSFADLPEDDVLQTNVAGFVVVCNVDTKKKTITLLSPQPSLSPNPVLLLSEMHFTDNRMLPAHPTGSE